MKPKSKASKKFKLYTQNDSLWSNRGTTGTDTQEIGNHKKKKNPTSYV